MNNFQQLSEQKLNNFNITRNKKIDPRKMAPMWGYNENFVNPMLPEETIMPYQNVNNKPIPQFQNGRVIGVSNVKSGNQFKMFTQNNNNNNDTKNTILYGTITRSQLSDTFFSNKNMKIIQDKLRYEVFLRSNKKYKIGNQNNTDLQIIMRAIYLQHSKHLPYNIRKQVEELNKYVVDFSLPKIISEIKQYIHYVKQLESMPNPIDLPQNVSSAGTRTLKSVTTTF